MDMKKIINQINDSDKKSIEEAKQRWNSIAHPLHSLGKLEDVVVKMSGIFETSNALDIEKKAHVVMCGDNGIVEEGVSQSGSEVTALVANNFVDVKSSVSIMCKKLGVTLFPLDLGMVHDSKIPDLKIARGTKNMTKEPAMSREEAIKAITIGIETVEKLKKDGYKIIGTGEMGIGNTTTSSAIASVLLGKSVESVTGKGAGLSDEGLIRKINAIKKAIEVNKPDKEDPLDVLAKLGGFDIAGLTGVFLGGAIYKIPIVIDGFISSVAALVAVKMAPKSISYILPSHMSKEPACGMLLNELNLEAFLNCDMRLGEGTGAVALFPLLDLAVEIYNKMSTFEQIDLEAYEEL